MPLIKNPSFDGTVTHALATLYHLANGGDAATNWKGVDSILRKADVSTLPKADVAVFVGTEFDALVGRSGDDEPTRLTPWGEIAWQLGRTREEKERLFAAVAPHDEQRLAPAGDVIRKMLPSGPILILMDELLNYVGAGRKIGMRDQFFNFLQNLCEEIRARNNAVLCVSIPRSDLEMNPDDTRDHDSIKKLCDRVGKAILMSADKEMSEIIRRRLFEWTGFDTDSIRVTSRGEQTTDPVIPSGPQTLQWSGAVPTQKWMHFYTKIVTRFATSPDLKIEVRFTVPVESEQMQAKVAEVKNGLRELGLDDNVIA